MFQKLLGNLPFNPSLIHQVAFYSQRLKSETALRRTGLMFLVLTMFVQFFAVISPPQPSLASSDNDIVRGGVGSLAQAVAYCQDPSRDFGKILEYYNVGCDTLRDRGNPNPVQLNSRALGGELDSIGRNPVPDFHPKTGKASNKYEVRIAGVPTLYMKNLWYWDSGSSSTYPAIEFLNRAGEQMWILIDCGNIVTFKQYNPPQPPPPPPPPPPVPPQELSCSNLVMNVPNDSRLKLGDQIIVRGQASGKNIVPGELVDMYYDFVDATTNKVISSQKALGIGFSGSSANDPQSRTFSTNNPGEYLIKLTVKYAASTRTALRSATGNCLKHVSVQKACPTAKNSQDLENCADVTKTATNVTQNIANAHNTTAKPGDVIKYTISITNTGNVTIPKFDGLEENISDILDYATVVDLGGGTKDSNHLVTWPAMDIKAKQVIRKTITVKIKDPIPSTPVSSSDPGHFDCVITNVVPGNSVAINIQCPVAKTVETTTSLPKTGPGESLAIGFVLTAAVGYFFARSRLFAVELDIVRQDFSSGEV